MISEVFAGAAALAATGLGLASWGMRQRGLHCWLGSYLRQLPSLCTDPANGERPIHLLLCIADHFEPKLGNATPRQAQRRVERWCSAYPRLFGAFTDSDGRSPRHSFFYPVDEYEPEYLDALAELCRAGHGEVEVHLHHDRDTPDNLTRTLTWFKEQLSERHGLLSRRATGDLAYGFIHGNWALDNSLPGGCWCGVNNELDVLRQTGCYADFTLPSAPSLAQTRTINRIYYAVDDPARPKSHDTGNRVGCGPQPNNSLMLIQGPLLLDWQRRKWQMLPRIENACLQGSQPPSLDRLDLWLRARVQVPTLPDWYFVKLHTHGANEANMDVLLDEPMQAFHSALAQRASRQPQFRYHYVSAREMYNLARAAEAGWTGTIAEALDYELRWNGSSGVSTSLVQDAPTSTLAAVSRASLAAAPVLK